MKKEEVLKSLLTSLLEKNLKKLETKNNDEIKEIKLMKLFFTKQQCLIESYITDIKRKEMTRQKTSDNLKPNKRNSRLFTPSNKKLISKSKDKSNIKEKENFRNLNKSKIDGTYRPKNIMTKKINNNNINNINNIEKKNYKTPLRKMSGEISSISKLKKSKKNNLMSKKNRMVLLESINRANKSFILNNKNNLNKSNNNISNDTIKTNSKVNTSNKKGIKLKMINKPKTNLFLEKFDKNKISNDDINIKNNINYQNFGEWLSSDDGRDILISISNYLDKKTKYNLFSCKKNYIKFLYEYINDKYTEFKENNKINPHSDTIQEKINEIKEKCSESDLNIVNTEFNLSIGTLKAIELLNNKEHLKFFSKENYSTFSDDLYIVYKIIFQLNKNNEIKNSENKKEFFEKMCKYISDNIKDDKIGDLFKIIVNNFDFSQENIFQIKKIIKGNEDKLKPKYYSKICQTTGLVIFLIKDILEYLGLNQTKKTSPAIILANLEFLEKMKTKIPNYLKTLQKYIQV